MLSQAASNTVLYLGIDGGGTSCRTRLVTSSGDVIGIGLAGPANPYQNIETTINSILRASRLAFQNANLHDDAILNTVAGAGLAGLLIPSLLDNLSAWHHPFKQCFFTTDLHCACLGAHNGQDGAVVVVGTGSCGIANVNGRSVTLGAHGFPAGDKGSGAWIGLEVLKAVLMAQDGLAPKTLLNDKVFQHYQCRGLALVEKFKGGVSRDFATLAPLAFEAAAEGDETASDILRDGAGYLNDLTEKLLELEPPRLSMVGGLAEHIKPWLREDIINRLVKPLSDAENGALFFARKEYDKWLGSVATSSR